MKQLWEFVSKWGQPSVAADKVQLVNFNMTMGLLIIGGLGVAASQTYGALDFSCVIPSDSSPGRQHSSDTKCYYKPLELREWAPHGTYRIKNIVRNYPYLMYYMVYCACPNILALPTSIERYFGNIQLGYSGEATTAVFENLTDKFISLTYEEFELTKQSAKAFSLHELSRQSFMCYKNGNTPEFVMTVSYLGPDGVYILAQVERLITRQFASDHYRFRTSN